MKSSLLQKYHINTLEEIVGQINNISFLKNSLFKNIFYPLYLFSGMRGSGKTTCARLFSLSLLCDRLLDFQKNPHQAILPCYNCYSCILYKKNQHPDIIELDAASHNGIDTIRSVIDNAYMLPVVCKKKIYIIDEVHMLSKAAFNACLKIMEEPPENVHFILATTEIHKVIDTIKSRSIILHFKPIPYSLLFDYLKKIINKENIIAEDKVINNIVELSEGSVRDALNILNRLAMIDEIITQEIVINEYGIIEKTEVENLLIQILEKNINKYYQIKNNLSLAELGKKKFFEHGVLYIQKLLENEYINKKNIYDINILQNILLHFYTYEEFFFTSQNPLGLFDLLLDTENTTPHINKKNIPSSAKNTIEKENCLPELLENITEPVKIQSELINQEINDFLKNLETVVNTILSQGSITINHTNKKLHIVLKKNFSFYKDFLVLKNNHIKEVTKNLFGTLYDIEYIFEDTTNIDTQKNKLIEKNIKKINENPIKKIENNTSEKILEQKEEIKKQQNKYIKNNFSQTKNTKKKISPETLGPLLTKINAEFPGSTYIEEE